MNYKAMEVQVSRPIYGSSVKTSGMTSTTPYRKISLGETSCAVQVAHKRCYHAKHEEDGYNTAAVPCERSPTYPATLTGRTK
jgi:hypothetical protein